VVILYGEKSHTTAALRLFRDEVLHTTPEGRELIELYYHVSPLLAQALEDDEEFKNALRALLDAILAAYSIR
jgi:predicted amino acid dehydrogenase